MRCPSALCTDKSKNTDGQRTDKADWTAHRPHGRRTDIEVHEVRAQINRLIYCQRGEGKVRRGDILASTSIALYSFSSLNLLSESFL